MAGRREDEVNVDMEQRAKGNMQTDKACGPEDVIGTEMLKELSVERMHDVTRWCSRR